MIVLPITSLFAGGFALALVALSAMVTARRVKTTILLGDGEIHLSRRIRAQANFIEYVPMGVLLLALMELQGVSAVVLVSLGSALAVGRVLHAIGMYKDAAILRGLGILATYGALLAAGVGVVLVSV